MLKNLILKNDSCIFNLENHKYSVIGAAVQTVQNDTGVELSMKKNKINKTVTVTRIS